MIWAKEESLSRGEIEKIQLERLQGTHAVKAYDCCNHKEHKACNYK